jgi:hypothetical protein
MVKIQERLPQIGCDSFLSHRVLSKFYHLFYLDVKLNFSLREKRILKVSENNIEENTCSYKREVSTKKKLIIA